MGIKSNKMIFLFGLILMAMFFNMFGCSKPGRKPQISLKNQTAQKSKPPKELTQIQAGLEKIYTALKPLQLGTPEQLQRTKEVSSQKEGESQQGKQKGGSQQEGGKGVTSSEEQVDWAKLHRQSALIHEKWNAFEPNAMKSGASPDAVEGFEKQLGLLSNKLAERDRYGSQLAANSAAAFLPDFIQLYDGRIPPDLLRLRCLARDVSLKAEAGDWKGAERDLVNISSVWSRARAEARGAKGDNASKIQYAISDLSDAVEARDKIVVMVKENIIVKNIDALIESLHGDIS